MRCSVISSFLAAFCALSPSKSSCCRSIRKRMPFGSPHQIAGAMDRSRQAKSAFCHSFGTPRTAATRGWRSVGLVTALSLSKFGLPSSTLRVLLPRLDVGALAKSLPGPAMVVVSRALVTPLARILKPASSSYRGGSGRAPVGAGVGIQGLHSIVTH
jgi:hypothetical protein